MTTIGSLFSGYGGLDMAVEAVTGATSAWFADMEPAAGRILAHHWLNTPNLGDITAVDWSAVEPIDILTGGFPCQDVSAAGKRAGLIRYGDRTRSGLWAVMAQAIDALRPRLVVAENVRGLLSAKTDANPAVLPCPGCVDAHGGDASLGMRALGAVLGDLAQLGYDAAWQVVRASDIGAPHQRARVILVAWPADTDRAGLAQWGQQPARDERTATQRGDIDPAGVSYLPTPTAQDAKHAGVSPAQLDRRTLALSSIAVLLPTPRVHSGGGGGSDTKRATRPGAGGPTLADAILLPTPRATDGPKGGPNQRGSAGDVALPAAVQPERWGKYAEAVERWEALTRPAPEPTETGPRGGQRLSPPFVEWVMGLPAGHVTSPEIGLSRNEQLKALGNGVVPAQAEHGLRLLLDAVGAAA